MIPCYYTDDIDYAQRRLSGTVVQLLDNTPVYVERVYLESDNSFWAVCNILGEDKSITAPITFISLTPVKLGYVNVGKDAIYTFRKPMRKDWKQGLSTKSFASTAPVSFSKLVHTIRGDYPTFLDSYSKMQKTASIRAIAFSRDFAILNNGLGLALMFRNSRVGSVSNGIPILDLDKHFLQQHLDDVVRNA